MPQSPIFETVLFEKRGSAAWITFNRPEAMNAMSPRQAADLNAALDAVEADRDFRCVVITGTGRAFCAGADLKEVKALGEGEDRERARKAFLDFTRSVLRRIELFPMPVIAAVNGLALAGGLEVVLVCDLVIAAEEAKLGDQHAQFGLLPGWGGSVRLPRKIGVNRAKELMFTARHVPARTMMEWGLVNQVVPLAELETATAALAAGLEDKSPLGLAAMKRMADDGMEQPLEVALRYETAIVDGFQDSHDRQEGLRAFAEKRKPQFKGR
ncbi:MAG: enoyl-CoA hydratase/isomerase family protein [Rhodobiaceae bacterium]|nr:enoyl-CoA hydratase/isomerase family protein [Rhodobiaceae bacterium]MCC0055933.1 enoyl-CoA hydratase/isomerase family protein [Rhodobiaceae bacterium]